MEEPIFHLEKLLRGKQEENSDFVGPLDLILHLLSKNKIEIKDISVAQVLDQYLEWVAQRQQMDLEVASDFIAMAAHLLYIKTRMLVSTKDEEALSEVEQLIASLEERKRAEDYERVKLVLNAMGNLYERGNNYLPTSQKHQTLKEELLYSHQTEELITAYNRTMLRNRSHLPPSPALFHGMVGPEPYPVEEKANELISYLRRTESISLNALWKNSHSRSEMVAVFIAILELCRTGQLSFVAVGDGDLLLISQNS